MSSMSADAKTAIKNLLLELKTAGTLGDVLIDDFKTSIFEREIAVYPTAIIGTPAIKGEVMDSVRNTRELSFEILIVQKGENIATDHDIEDLAEAVMDKFDNHFDLNGYAVAGVEPATSAPDAITSGDKTFIAFTVSIKAKILKTLTP